MEGDDEPVSRGRSRSYRDEVAEELETSVDPDGPPLPVLSSSSTTSDNDSSTKNSESSTSASEDADADGPPMYDPNAVFDSSSNGNSSEKGGAGDDESEDSEDDDDEEDDDEDDEPLPRTRARSKSVFDPYGALENEKGVVLINPSVIEEIANKAAADAAAPSGNASPESLLLKQQPVERKGPLQLREVEALRKGVEEAIQPRNPDIIREEREEKIAAEEERRVRLSIQRESIKANDMSYRRIKLLMLGDTGVGKSSLMQRWTADTFNTDLMGTVGVNFKSKNLTVCGENIQAQVWDTAGQERFHKITTSYYKASQGIVLVLDVSNKKSQENIEYWMSNIRQHSTNTTQLILVANKIDLRETAPQECMTTADGEALAKQYDLPYFETSAKDNLHIHEAFHTLINNIQKAEIMALMSKAQGGADPGRRNSGSFFSARPTSPRSTSQGAAGGFSPGDRSPGGSGNVNNAAGGCALS